MNDFRQTMLIRRVRNIKNALAVLAGVLRHDDDPHAVRITFSTADGEQSLGSLCLGLLALTELADAIRTRATDVARPSGSEPRIQPAPSELRLVPVDQTRA